MLSYYRRLAQDQTPAAYGCLHTERERQGLRAMTSGKAVENRYLQIA
jgi:hypothetical protein